MTSKKLGALLRTVPPATVAAAEEELPVSPVRSKVAPPASPASAPKFSAPVSEPEVPLTVLIPGNIRRELAVMAAREGVSIRALVLKGIRGLGVPVTEVDIAGKRGRKAS